MFDLFPKEILIPQAELERINSRVRSSAATGIDPSIIPSVVYHYTNASGFKSIIESGRIRSTHISYLNDSSEYLHAVATFEAVAHKLAGNISAGPARDAINQIVFQLEQASVSAAVPCFISSFSEVENSLSQWRAYGGDGGYCIALDTRELGTARPQNRESKIGPWMAPIIYGLENQTNIAEELLSWAIAEYQSNLRESNRNDSYCESWVWTFLSIAALLAPRFKNPGFAEEREWRLVYLLQSVDELVFSTRRSLIVPHVDLIIGDNKNDGSKTNMGMLPIRKVWIGPGPNQQIAMMSARAILEKSRYFGISLQISEIPYRIM